MTPRLLRSTISASGSMTPGVDPCDLDPRITLLRSSPQGCLKILHPVPQQQMRSLEDQIIPTQT